MKQALSIMFKFFEKSDTQLYELYLRRLNKEDHETIIKQIQYLIDTATFFPKVSEILKPLAIAIDSQMQRDWEVFMATRCNNLSYEPMPDWVYTIKQHIGEKRCEDILEEEIHWLKREYDKVYPLVKNGTIAMKSQPVNYVQIGNMSVVIGENVEMHKFPLLAKRIAQTQIEGEKALTCSL